MTKQEWIELERRVKAGELFAPGKRKAQKLLEATRQEREHPEWYNQWCECMTCMSYA